MSGPFPPVPQPPPDLPPREAPALPAPPPQWQRLDARMLLVHPVLELFRFLPVVVGVVAVGSQGGPELWQLLGVGIPIALGVLRFLTTQYRITPSQVELQRGLLGRKVLTARLDRVRAVELTSSPIHRVLGLAKVEIGTASGGKDEDTFALDSLGLAQARELRAVLLHRADREEPDVTDGAGVAVPGVAAPEVVLLRLDPRWVRFAPLTSSGNVIAAGVLAVLGQFSDRLGARVISDEDLRSFVERVSLGAVVPLALAAFLVLGAVFALLGYLVTNWRFTLSRDARGRSFHIRRGLLTSTETSLERARVRGLEVYEPLGLRLAGAAKLAAVVTGVSDKEGGSTLLVPPAPRGVIDGTGAEVIGDATPLHLPLRQHGPAARRRRFTRALAGASVVPAAVLVVALTSPLPWWPVLPALLALPVGAALAVDRYARLGHALTEGHLVVRSGTLRGRRDVLQRTGIIGWNIQQSWFQRRAGLATLVATTAAGDQAYAALDIPLDQAVALADAAAPGLLGQFTVAASGSAAG